MTSTNEHPQPDLNDKSDGLAGGLRSAVPASGGVFAEIFSPVVSPVIERRSEKWYSELHAAFLRLERERANFSFAKAFDDEVFVTTFLMASRLAQINHNEENLTALRHAVLNAALPDAPDESRQKIFVAWAGELTAWHIRILKLFKDKQAIPTLQLDNPIWRGLPFEGMAKLIEEKYPELRGEFHTQIQIIGELHAMELITNRSPEKGRMAKIHSHPRLTAVAQHFLVFIEPPIPA